MVASPWTCPDSMASRMDRQRSADLYVVTITEQKGDAVESQVPERRYLDWIDDQQRYNMLNIVIGLKMVNLARTLNLR